jgi:Domain of unknown function (DUF5615)
LTFLFVPPRYQDAAIPVPKSPKWRDTTLPPHRGRVGARASRTDRRGVKFKLDGNLSPSLLALFAAAGHDAHSVVHQSLGGQPDERVIDVCRSESRALITLDLEFCNILASTG